MMHNILAFMKKSKQRVYSEPFRLEVLRDYYLSGMCSSFTIKKWDLGSVQLLRHWIKRYPIDSELLSLPSETILRLSMCDSQQSKEELLEQEIQNLKKALELEKLRSRAFEKLIEITEKEEGISILKKDGAKQ